MKKVVLQCLIAGIIQLLACVFVYLFNIPNPNIVLFVILSAALVQFGYAAGTVTGIISILYSAFFFSTQHSWIYYTPLNRNKLIVIVLGVIANIYVIGKLQRANQKAVQKITRLKIEQQSAAEMAELVEKAESANKAKSRFLANMSHDIRTPLNVILGFAKIIADNPSDKDSVKNAATKIQFSGNILLDLVNDILDINRIENGKLHLELVPTDLNALGQDLNDMFLNKMQSAGINFLVKTSIHTPFVMCDCAKLREILVNLLENAQKFTKAGESVSLFIQEEEALSYRFTVKDSGIGISPEFQTHMFEAFERERTSTISNKTGTGLGLAIVKGLIELMGGKIDVQSEPGKGTEINLKLSFIPAENIQETINQTPAEDKTENLDGVRILLVEDNELNREIADTLLTTLKAMVTNAKNGAEAVELFAKNPPGTFDVILMDIMMPVMDGLVAAKNIRSLEHQDSAKIPIFAMTANAFAEDIAKSRDAGMNEHLCKPLNMNALVSAIRRYI